MTEGKTVMLYAGKRVDDMTRDELVQALAEMGELLRQAHDDHGRTLRTWEAARRTYPVPDFVRLRGGSPNDRPKGEHENHLNRLLTR